jgi:hypothetical protein
MSITQKMEKLKQIIVGGVNYFVIADMGRIVKNIGYVAKKEDTHVLLETVEKNQNKTR